MTIFMTLIGNTAPCLRFIGIPLPVFVLLTAALISDILHMDKKASGAASPGACSANGASFERGKSK